MFLFKKTAYNCKEATRLALKKDEGKISLLERFRLYYHLRFCDPCHGFIKQSHIINEAGAQLNDTIFKEPLFTLSEERKKDIQHQLDILDQ